MGSATGRGRTRVERGIYRQPNGKFAVCARRAGGLHFRTAGRDLGAARQAREELVAAWRPPGAGLAATALRHRGCALERALRGDGGGRRAPPAHL